MTDAEAPATRSRRGGGRAARRAARAAPLPENLRPVRAGLEGGAYAPLSEAGVARIHETALRALEEIGLADAPPSGIEALTSAGAALGDDGRVRIPPRVVEEMLAVAARDVTLCGQDPGNDLRPGGARVHYGTAGAAVHVYDPALGDHDRPLLANGGTSSGRFQGSPPDSMIWKRRSALPASWRYAASRRSSMTSSRPSVSAKRLAKQATWFP